MEALISPPALALAVIVNRRTAMGVGNPSMILKSAGELTDDLPMMNSIFRVNVFACAYLWRSVCPLKTPFRPRHQE